ncbi:MAG TPA: ABC transporter substrate-binding protein [bacterium]|nr:ABC transporter substrate-binding protein [bacterium]
MRRFVAAAAAVVLIATWAPLPGRSATAYTPQQTVVIAMDISSVISLDPQVSYEFTEPDHLAYSTLVEFAQGDLTHPRPSVASSWTSSKDAKTYTFHLRPGVKFASGNVLTAADVLYTFERAVNIPKDPASWLITQMGIDPKNVDQIVKTPDPQTVVVTLPEPFSPGAFLSIMANTVAGIVDSKTVRQHVTNNDWGTGWLVDHSAGSGPYELARWERLVTIDLVANPTYNLSRPPSIKRIVWPNIQENTVQRNMLERGDADIATGLSAAQLDALKHDNRFYVAQIPDLGEEYVGMDVKNVPAFQKAQVRQAVRWAIDYDGIVRQLLNGNGLPLQSIVPKGLFGYDPALPFKHDPAKAKALLAEAGFGNGFSATMLAPSGSAAGGISAGDLASKIKNDLGAVGINVTIRQVASSEMYQTYRGQKSEMVLANWYVDYPDPDDFSKPFGDYKQKSLCWRLQYYNDPLSALVNQAGGLENTPQRGALYKRINDVMNQDGPFALLYQPMISNAASKRIQHLVFDPVNFIDFFQLTKQ